MRRAEEHEKRLYNGLHELYGYITVRGKLGRLISRWHCPIERLYERPGNPKYEVIAPDGAHFAGDPLHTLLCFDLADVKERTEYAFLEPCNCDNE